MKFPNIRISPLGLFLITLFALFLSIVLGKYMMGFRKENEGFLNFQYGTSPLSQVSIPKYSDSKKLILIYDNLYYDSVNGNIVDIRGNYSETLQTASADLVGTTINSFKVIQRNGSESVDYPYSTVSSVSENGITSSSVSSTPFTKISTGDAGHTYQYLYIPWGRDTYLHLIRTDSTAKLHVGSYFLGSSDVGNSTAYSSAPNSYTTDAALTSMYSTSSTYTISDKENKFGKDSTGTYDQTVQLFTVANGVQYDNTTGNLIITDGASGTTMKVYKRSILANSGTVYVNPSATSTYTPNGSQQFSVGTASIPNVNGLSTMVVYTSTGLMVVYIGYGTKTIVLVCNNNTGNATSLLHIQNVARFDSKGTFVTGTEGLPTATATTTQDVSNNKTDTSGKTSSTDADKMDDFLNRFFKYYYSVGASSNDYLLKTQVVPPVCPTCPSCPSSGGVCTNCGGNGGSGTKHQDGKNILDRAVGGTLDVARDTVGGVTDLAKTTVGDATDLAKSAGSGASDLAKSAAGGASDLAKSAAGGAVGLAKDTASGTIGVAREVAGGAIGLAKDVAGGAVGLVKDAASGVASVLPNVSLYSSSPYVINGQPTTGYGYGGQVVPTVYNTRGNDPYSMYGALQERSGGNYIPITADFSAFGR